MTEYKVWDREKIKTLRKLKGMTQKDLAEKVGLSVPAVSCIETGKRKASRFDILLNVAEALDTPPWELVK